MMGCTLKEIYESLEHNGEVEFEYNAQVYVVQPEIIEHEHYLTISTVNLYSDNNFVLKEKIFSETSVDKESIDRVLNAKCFDGKSFIDIEKDIKVLFLAVVLQ